MDKVIRTLAKLSHSAEARRYFDEGTRFREFCRASDLLDGYDDACNKAYLTAKAALINGDRMSRERAIFAEAAAQTYESILSYIPHVSEERPTEACDEVMRIPTYDDVFEVNNGPNHF